MAIAQKLATHEDYGLCPEYFTPSSFTVAQVTGVGQVQLCDVSTVRESGAVKGALSSLAYCILGLIIGVDRESLPSDLSSQTLRQYKGRVPPGVYSYLDSLVSGEFSTVRSAYDAIRLVSWEYATPLSVRLKPGRKALLCLSISLGLIAGVLIGRALLKEPPDPAKPLSLNSDNREQVNELALRYKVFIERDCQGCNLSGLRFKDVDLSWVNLQGANLEGASIVSSDVTGINLAGANLDHASLDELEFIDASLSEASIEGAWFSQILVTRTDMSYVDMTQNYVD